MTAGSSGPTIIDMISGSGPVVQSVLYLLVAISIASWAVVVYKARQIRSARKGSERFVELFWETRNLTEISKSCARLPASPVAEVFKAGYQELVRLRNKKTQAKAFSTELPGVANVAGMCSGYLFFLATRRLPTRRKIAFELRKRKASVEVKAESVKAEQRNQVWDPKIREAVSRASSGGAVAPEDEPFLAELDAARDPSITVCAPEEFGMIDDQTCRTCPGFAECGARAIRLAAEGDEDD